MPNKRCGGCAHLDVDTCYAHPPVPKLFSDGTTYALRPEVRDFTRACGEWQPIPDRFCPQHEKEIPDSDRPDKKYYSDKRKRAFKRATKCP